MVAAWCCRVEAVTQITKFAIECIHGEIGNREERGRGERGGQTDSQTGRQTSRQAHRQTKTNKQTKKQTERWKYRDKATEAGRQKLDK